MKPKKVDKKANKKFAGVFSQGYPTYVSFWLGV